MAEHAIALYPNREPVNTAPGVFSARSAGFSARFLTFLNTAPPGAANRVFGVPEKRRRKIGATPAKVSPQVNPQPRRSDGNSNKR